MRIIFILFIRMNNFDNSLKKLDKVSNNIIEDCVLGKKVNKEKIVGNISLWLDKIIYTSICLLHIMAIDNNKKSINKEVFDLTMQKIQPGCKHSKKGGRLGSATYLGAEESMYSTSNEGSDILQVTDYEIRPQIGGKPISIAKYVMSHIKFVLKYLNFKASKEVQNLVSVMIINEVRCLANDLQNKGQLNLSKVQSVLKKHEMIH